MAFLYDKEVTRKVCRSCSIKYEDSYFADELGTCTDCGVNMSHGCFTNEPKLEVNK